MNTTPRTELGARLQSVGGSLGAWLARGSSNDALAASVPQPLSAAEFDVVAVDVGNIWISKQDEVMRPFMQRAHTWEPEEGRLLRSLTKPGCRFLDVGANVGYFSILVGKAAPGVTVDAVEPDPENVRALRFNLWSNRVAATVWPLALDSSDRHLALAGNAHNLGDLRSGRIEAAQDEDLTASVLPPPSDDDRGSADATRPDLIVPAASGEELFAGRGFDLVKIDVQGWEMEVILGLDAVLLRSPGVRIVAEFWPGSIRANDRTPTDILARYRQLGYRLRAAMGDDLVNMTDSEIVAVCDSAGPDGQINLLLER